VSDMDEPDQRDIQQTDTPADQSSGADDISALLAQFEAETARPAAANGHADDSADAPINGEPVNGDAPDNWLENAILDAENAERTQRSRAYYASLQLDKKIQTIQAHEYERDLTATVANVRGSLDKNQIRDAHVQAWLDTQVRQDETLKNTWLNRAQDPRMWQAAERNLKAQFHKEFSRQVFDTEATEDRALVASAIRGAAGPAQVEPSRDYARMSNKDFREELQSLGIQSNV
jgi:hypothetical protein